MANMETPTPVYQTAEKCKEGVVVSPIGRDLEKCSDDSSSKYSGHKYSSSWSSTATTIQGSEPLEVIKELPPPVTQPRKQHQFTVRKLRKHARDFYDYLRLDLFTTYRLLWCLIVAVNLAVIIVDICRDAHKDVLSLASPANAAVANLLVAVLVRQDYVKNLMYETSWLIPHSAPFWIRKRAAYIYENGGVHSGSAVSALLWFAVFTGYLWTNFARGDYSDVVVLTFDCILAVLLLTIVIGALPQVRRAHHNAFENTHRWAGWFGIGLFWIAVVLFARDEARLSSESGHETSIGLTLVKLPAFWLLVIISGHAIYPWVLLRKVEVVKSERLSDHAIRVFFNPKEKIPLLHGCAISDNPIYEWHGFAAVPDLDGSHGGSASVIISKAGDWTSKAIDNPAPYYYMRGVHATGVLSMGQVFRRIIVMATGSGIGPCLAFFGLGLKTKMRVIWSTPNPRAIFGEEICDRVKKEDPNAVIWDTRLPGQKRPDLTQMAYDMYLRENIEAIFFISNRKLTKRVIKALRLKGVPAYSPVFDS